MSSNSTESIAIAKRYATAMFELAVGAKQQTVLIGEIRSLADAIAASPELEASLKNPLVSRMKKSALLHAIMAKASPLTKQSLGALAAQGRAELIAYVADALDVMLADHEGTLTAEITSARPLDKTVETKLRDSLSEATGRDVKLHMTQDPAVLGGVAIRVGSHLLDATLAGALNAMKTKLLTQAAS